MARKIVKEIALIAWWTAIAASWMNVALGFMEKVLTGGCPI